jgi:site-specific recombinase XerD
LIQLAGFARPFFPEDLARKENVNEQCDGKIFRGICRDSCSPHLLSERGPMTRQAVNYLAEIGERANLRFYVHPHMLRHSTGYYLANRGYDTKLAQDYLGHKNIAHTVRYTRTAAVRFEGLWR